MAELIEHRPGYARTIASAYAPGMELREGHEFALAGTPCEHAYEHATCCSSAAAPACATRRPLPRRPRGSTATWRSRCAAPTAARSATSALVSTGPLDPAPSELQALQVFAARAAAELERRRHERALRARADEVVATPRPRRARRRRGAPPDRPRPARRRAAAARRPRPGARPRAARSSRTTRSRRSERLTAAREQASLAGRELRELARGLHPVGLERGLRGRARRARRRSRRCRSSSSRSPSAAFPTSSRPRSGSSSPRRSRTRSSTPARRG